MGSDGAPQTWTVGQAAKLLCCPEWWLRRQFKLGRLPEPPRIGIFRVLGEADLLRARVLCEQQGKGQAPAQGATQDG